MLKFDSHVADPIHSFIAITPKEREVIDSPAFQRLRRIKQLGNVHLLFPSAVHNRFAHCLGVMHVAGLIFQRLEESISVRPSTRQSKALEYVHQMVRLAGLLHDIGHGPLSHHFEDCLKTYNKRSDSFSPLKYKDWSEEMKLPKTWISKGRFDAFVDCDLEHEHFSFAVIRFLGESLDFDARAVCSLLCSDILPSKEFNDHIKVIAKMVGAPKDTEGLRLAFKSILSGEIDADRIDYLLRDSYFCGTKTASIDIHHLLTSLSLGVHENKVSLLIRPNAVAVVENILISRKQMFDQVYNHRLNGSFDYLLSEVVKSLIIRKEVEIPYDVLSFLELTDEWLEYLVHEKAAVRQQLNFSKANLDNRDGLAVTCARFFITRTPLVRLDRRDAQNADQVASITKDLNEIYKKVDPIIWPMKLKKFYGEDRFKAHANETLKVSPATQTDPPLSLRIQSGILNSTAWMNQKTRIFVFANFRESAKTRGLSKRLEMMGISPNKPKRKLVA